MGRYLSLVLTVLVLAGLPPAQAAQGSRTGPATKERREVVALRTATSRTYLNEDGSLTTQMFLDPLHFQDDEGKWMPIRSRLLASAKYGYDWRNEANAFDVLFKDRLEGEYLSFKFGDHSFSLSSVGGAPVPSDRAPPEEQVLESPSPEVTPLPSEDIAPSAEPPPDVAVDPPPAPEGIGYPGAFPSVDLRYEVLPEGIKETLVLEGPEAASSFDFLLATEDLADITAEPRDDGAWLFYDDSSPDPLFVMERPFALDSSDPVSEGEVDLAVTKMPEGFELELQVDRAWLDAPERVFPVYVDPTITLQPSLEDASFDASCSNCTGVADQRLNIGTDQSKIWRSALQFDLGDVPVGADVTAAQLKLYFDNYCLYWGQSWCSGTHQIDVHRMTTSWTKSSTSGSLAFDPTQLSSFSVGDSSHQWMNWDITSTVRAWVAGTQTNFGLLLKRSTEALSSGGPRPPSSRYSEPGLRPKLEVTYNGDGVFLHEPTTLHSDGAELVWERFVGPSPPPFEKYEIHRSATPRFTPSASTLLGTIGDASVTTYRDVTAAPGKTFYYRVMANSIVSNERAVTLPSDGNATKLLQPDTAAGKSTFLLNDADWPESCETHGAGSTLFIGPAQNGDVLRPLLSFDLGGVPPGATVQGATMSVWRPEEINHADTVSAYRVTRSWDEGTGVNHCTRDGATWNEAASGVAWTTGGGDIDPSPVASMSLSAWQPEGWDRFDLTSVVQQWVSGQAPNHGVQLRVADESIPSSYRSFRYWSDDYTVAPTLRPKLSVSYVDGSHARGPVVSISSPQEGTKVSGPAVQVTATATDDRRVDSVEFLIDDAVKHTDAAAPYEMTWDTTSGSSGAHTLKARAIDDAGNTTTSAPVSVTVDNSAFPTASLTAPTFGSYQSTVLGDSPRAYWRLGEPTGATTAADASGNGHTGTYDRSTPGVPGGLVDDANTAMSVPGSGDGMVVTDRDTLDFGTSDFTAEAWIKTAVNAERAVMGKNPGSGPYWEVTVTDDAGKVGQVRAQISDGTTSKTYYGPAKRVDDNAWHHVVVVFDRDWGGRVYVDGVEAATSGPSLFSVSNAGDFRLGDTGGSPEFDGTIDEAALYPAALSVARAQAHFNAGAHAVKGTVPLSASASDDQGVTKVEFLVDGTVLAEDTTSPYSASWNTLDSTRPAYDGPHTLAVRAYDTSGQSSTPSFTTVTVDNTNGTKYEAAFSSTALPPAVLYDPAAQPQLSYGADVTVTNLGNAVWSATNTKLYYRWLSPDTPPTTTDGPAVSLASDLAPGASATLRVMVSPPVLAEGIDRALYTLRFDLKDSPSTWFAAKGNPPLEAGVTVNKARPVNLGLERYYHYEGEPVGAGMATLSNVASGNVLLRWMPFSSPGRGLSTVSNLTYNSLEQKSRSPVGNNFSMGISSLVALGTQLDVHPNKADEISGRSNRFVDLIDADGTRHRFEGKQAGDGTIYWEEPAGVHLYLRTYSDSDPQRKWALTRPDGVTFSFDADGYPTFVEDKNGNRISFTLEDTPPGEDPGGPKKRITKITDAAGQGPSPAPNRSFSIDYYSKAEAKKAHVRGKIEAITDRTGSALRFSYYDDGNLLRITQVGGANADGTALPDRSLVFTYTTSDGSGPAIPAAADRVNPDPKTANQSTRLYSVRDPRGAETLFAYCTATNCGDSKNRWKLKTRTNRTGSATAFAYDNTNRVTTVTAPLSRVTKFAYDAEGKVTSLTNPKNEVTTLVWGADRHVTRVAEPTGKFTDYSYNANGYPLSITDQLGNRTDLTYLDRAADAADPLGSRDRAPYWKAGRQIPHLSLLRTKTNPRGTATPSPPDDFQWLFDYDAKGNLTRVTEPEGSPPYTTQYAYNPDGTLATVTDANTRVTAFNAYDANGLPIRITDAKGQVTQFGYDDDGLLRWIQDPLHAGYSGGDPRTYRSYFDYDSFHRLGRQSTPKSTVQSAPLIWSAAAYDPNDNMVSEFAPEYGYGFVKGPEARMTYDAMDRLTSASNPQAEKTEYLHDAAGRVTRLTSPKGVATTGTNQDHALFYDYDVLDRAIREIRYDTGVTPVKALTTHFCYDLAGDLVSQTAPKADLGSVNCATPPGFTARYTYDAAHRLLSETDPLGHRTDYGYDADGNLTSAKNPLGDTTTYAYGARGLLEKAVQPFNSTRDVTTLHRYDGVGNLIELISPRAYDASADKVNFPDFVTKYAYDAVNQLTKIELPSQGAQAKAYIHRDYDSNGNLVVTTLPDPATTLSGVPEERKTSMTYLDTGWVATTDDDVNPRVVYDYNARGQQTSRKAGSATEEIWRYATDGMLEEHKDRGIQGIVYAYDQNNNLTSAIDRSGITTPNQKPIDARVTYDALDRVAKVRHRREGDAETNYRFSTFFYDLNSNVTERADNGVETESGSQVTAPKRHQFTYDQADWLTTQLDFLPSGCQKIDNTFTATGWEATRTVRKATQACDGSPAYSVKQSTEWTYFKNGKLKTLVTRNGPVGTGQVMESHDVGYLDPQGTFVNGHRATDTFTKKGPHADCQSSCTATYTYDSQDRLVEEKRTPGPTTSYELDPAGNVTRKTTPSGSTYFTHSGMRLDKVAQGTPTNYVARYLYDPEGNLDCVTDPSYPGSCSGATTAQLIKDYTYDYLSRLSAYKAYSGGQVTDEATYEYDPLDRVVKETERHGSSPQRATDFSYLGLTSLVTQEAQSGDPAKDATKTYSYDAYGHRISMTHDPADPSKPTESFTYGYDVHGSVSLLLGESGQAKAAYGYDAYGEKDPGLSGGDPEDNHPLNPYRYTGKRFDSGSQTLDMGARRFGPDTTRFLQPDLFQGALSNLGLSMDPLTGNRYSLAGGNPLSFIEGDGHYPAPDGSGTAAHARATKSTTRGSTAGESPQTKELEGDCLLCGTVVNEWYVKAENFISNLPVFEQLEEAAVATQHPLTTPDWKDDIGPALDAIGVVSLAGPVRTLLTGVADAFRAGGFRGAVKALTGRTGQTVKATRGASQLRFTPRLQQGSLDEGLEHIAYRHWHSSGFSGVSKFGKDVGVRDLRSFIQQAARTGSWETQGLGHVIRANLGRTIGTTATGAQTSWIRIVSGRQGQVVTAYPIPAP